MRHLLFLTPGFPVDETDSTCIPPLQALVRELATRRSEIRISVITFQYPFEAEEYAWHGVRIYACGGSNTFLLKPQTWYRAVELANKANRLMPVDAIHSFWLGECFLVGRWLERKFRKPHWATLMGQDARPENAYLRLFDLSAMNLIALSTFHAQFFADTSGVSVRKIIPWGLDEKTDLPTKMPAERDIDILGAGSFINVKNWPRFFEIIHLLTEKRLNLVVWLVGGGTEKEHLEQVRREMGLGQVVKFFGAAPRGEVLKLMQRTKVFLHTSDYESFGAVLTEASANGCRIVSTPVGIAPELDFCETAWEVADLANLVEQNLEKPLRAEVILPFSIKETADEYLALAELETQNAFTEPPADHSEISDFGGGQ